MKPNIRTRTLLATLSPIALIALAATCGCTASVEDGGPGEAPREHESGSAGEAPASDLAMLDEDVRAAEVPLSVGTDEFSKDDLEAMMRTPTLPPVVPDRVVEPPPEDVTHNAGKKTRNTICFRQEACDRDGDGFAYEGCLDEVCPAYDPGNAEHVQRAADGHCTRDGNGDPRRCCDPDKAVLTDKNMCGESYVQSFQTEPLECDHVQTTTMRKGGFYYVSIANLDEIKSHIREEAIADGTFAFPSTRRYARTYVQRADEWEAILSDVHPGRGETPFNGVDDDCDGYVDETEYAYHPDGYRLGRGKFEIFTMIRSQAVRDHASHVIARVFDLDDLVNNTHLKHMRLGAAANYPAVGAPSPVDVETYSYGGERYMRLEVDHLSNLGDVYAVEVSFLYSGVGGVQPLRCLDDRGEPTAVGVCDAEGNPRNRIASQVYFIATDSYRFIPPGWHRDPQKKLQRQITNRAIHAWNLSKIGWVGWQHNYGFDPYWPNGDLYTGRVYQRQWCSEFVAHVYNRADSSLMSGDWTNVGTADMYDWFDANSEMLLDEDARVAIADWDTEPLYGSYLMMGCSGGGDSCDGEEKGAHSGIVIGYSPGRGNRGRLWRIGGNEGRRIKLRSKFLQGRDAASAGDTYYRGLGVVP